MLRHTMMLITGLLWADPLFAVITNGIENKATCTVTPCTTSAVTTVTNSTYIVSLQYYDTGCSVTSVTDSKSNTYSQLGVERTVTGGGGAKARQYYVIGGVGGASHTFTVTTSANCLISIWVNELRGTNITLDVHDSQVDSVSPYTSPGITTNVANAMLIGFISEGSSSGTCTHTHGESFTQLNEITDCNTQWTGAISYRSVSSTGTYNTSVTVTGTFTDTANYISAWYEAGGGSSSKGMLLGVYP